MKFTQTAVIETELPPEADVADFVNGDGDTEPEQDIFDEALQLTKEAVDIAIENREAETDSPSLDVEPTPADEPFEGITEELKLLAQSINDPEYMEIAREWVESREKWELQCDSIRLNHALKMSKLRNELVQLDKLVEERREYLKEAQAERKQCLSDLMDGEKKGPELPKKPECITYERFLELKEAAKDNPDAPPITLATATQSPNQDEEWKSAPTSKIFEGKTIKGLGKKKIEAVCDVAPTLGELEELRNQASLKHLHFCKMLPKGIGEELADAIQDLMYPHTYPNSKGV